MKLAMTGLGIAMVAGLLPLAAFAHEFKAGDLLIGHPWTRATPAGAGMAAGYLTVQNSGKEAEVLEGAKVGDADAMLHTTRTKDGVSEMMMLQDGITIPAGQTVTLKPGGDHMMWEIKAPLKEGSMVDGVLMFKNAKAVKVQFKVEAAGALMPAHMAGHQH